MTVPPRRSSAVSRRTLIAGSIAGIGSVLAFATPASAASNYAVIPKLPGEVSRLATATSRVGKKPYEVITVNISGDLVRLFVPHSAKPSLTTDRAFVWYYHARGTDHTALSTAFGYAADQSVDRGMISICPNYGGSIWTSQPAITMQDNTVRWVTGIWKVGTSFLRANSGGGPLLAWAYGNRLVPNVLGAYVSNGTYDMEERAVRDASNVLPYYNNDMAQVAATNPARIPQSAWAGARYRITGSPDDIVVPFEQHGAVLHNQLFPVAKEATILSYDGNEPSGHVIPGETNRDMLDHFDRWLAEGPVAGPPTTEPVTPSVPVGAGTYQNGASEIVTTGTWAKLSSTADNGGSISHSTTTGASASLTFTGTKVSWISRKTSSSGINEVYIDGKLVATVDRYSSTTTYKQTVYTSGTLTAGEHTITIKRGSTKNAASTGSNIILDAFVVGTSTGTPTTPALPGAGTYQNAATEIVTTGTWANLSSTADNGGSISHSTTIGASASLTFTGTKVSWISRKTSTSGTNEVYIDGALVTTIDRYSATTKYKQTVYTSPTLTAGEHTITIKRGSTKNAASTGSNIILDAFVVQ